VIDFSQLPVLCELPADMLQAQATITRISAGAVIFYEGDPSDQVIVLVRGTCQIAKSQQRIGEVTTPTVLDAIATFGNLPHQVRITASEDCEMLHWSQDTLGELPNWGAAARRYLAQQAIYSDQRRAELAAPPRWRDSLRAELPADAFRFENTTMIFAFSRVTREIVQLPKGLNFLQLGSGETIPLLLVFADFPYAYPESDPESIFRYRETTCFIPVRYQSAFGLYVAAIISSAYEPILLGREIYGFPKQIGDTQFYGKTVHVTQGTDPLFDFSWQRAEGSNEPRLIRSLSDWLGVEGRLASGAFVAGELLRKVRRLPAFRRVDVYNHKQILSANSQPSEPRYGIDQLTRSTFGVLNWQQITLLDGLSLTTRNPIWDQLTVQSAFRTQLDLRLSTGRIIQTYGDVLHETNEL